jgi:hypothetical protein
LAGTTFASTSQTIGTGVLPLYKAVWGRLSSVQYGPGYISHLVLTDSGAVEVGPYVGVTA